MLAAALKLLPLLQFLLDVLKADDGRFTAKSKAMLMAGIAILSFSAYVSYAYVQQFHALVELKAHQQYLVKSEGDANERAERAEARVSELEYKLELCQRRPGPYEGKSAYEPPKQTVPDTPAKAAAIVAETQPPKKTVPSPSPFQKKQPPPAVVPTREEREQSLRDRMERIFQQINN